MLWDAVNLYVGYWVEEPFVEGTPHRARLLIYKNNDVELFIAGKDAYYEFEINSLGTIYEVFFIWEQAYESAGYAALPEFARGKEGVRPFPGVGFRNHPRGPRIGYWNWDLPGLRTAVHVDGTLNDNTDRDRGWTVELVIPWTGLTQLARPDGRALRRRTATSGAWISRASTSTRKPRRRRTRAAGPGARTGSGTRTSPSSSRTSPSPSCRLGEGAPAADERLPALLDARR